MAVALKISTPTPPPAPRGVAWIDVPTAAKRSGLAERSIRHNCETKWAAAGLARLEAINGKPAWSVREDADPRLSRVVSLDTLNAQFDLNALTEKQRALLLFRESAVLDWEKLRGQTDRGAMGELTEAFVAERARQGISISSVSLWRWSDAYKAQGRFGLVDQRWRMPGGTRGGDDEFTDFYAELEDWYLDQNEPTMRTAYKLAARVAQKNGWAIPCEKTATRYLKKLNHGKVVRGRKGEDAFVATAGAYIQRDYTRIVIDGVERAMFSNDIWCADHHICDTLVSYEGKLIRPWLTAWEDLRSRKIVGYYFSPTTPDSSTVLLALRNGIMSNGLALPRFAYTDNGKDFACWMLNGSTKWERRTGRVEHDQSLFKGVYAHLQIGVMMAIPYNAKAKPVERFFGRYEQQFGKLTHTYCGRDPQHKPPHLEDRIKRNEAPLFDEYVRDAATWIEKVYHQETHSGHGMDGQIPNAVYAAQLGEIRTTTREALEICLQKTSRPVKVGRNGVTWGHYTYGRGNAALIPWLGKPVQLRVDPTDVTRVSVWSEDGRFICEAIETELAKWGAIPDAKSKQIHATIRRHNRALAEVQRFGPRMRISPLDVLLDERLAAREAATAAAEQQRESLIEKLNAATPPADAPSDAPRDPWAKLTERREAEQSGAAVIMPVRTGFESQKVPLRKAVGAESQSEESGLLEIRNYVPKPQPDEDAVLTMEDFRRAMLDRAREGSSDSQQEEPHEA